MSANAPMFDGQPMTKREVRLARVAVDAAINSAWPWIRASAHREWIGSDAIKDELYPLPTVTRPRVVKDSCGVAWRVITTADQPCDALIEYRERGEQWRDYACASASAPSITVERVRLLHELVLRPAEEVDA